MKKLILVRYSEDTKELDFQVGKSVEIKKDITKSVFTNLYDFNSFFDPFKVLKNNRVILNILVLEIRGKNYKEKSECLRNLVLDIQSFYSEKCDFDISWNEYAIVNNWLETKAKLFGLTKEFKENAII